MYAKVSYLNLGLLRSNIFKLGLRSAQRYTNLQLLVESLFESVKRLRLDTVRKKWDKKHYFPFERCRASTPEPIPNVLCKTARCGMQ